MADGGRIIEGLQQAVAHAKGEATGAREHVTVSRAELEALRAVAAAARDAAVWLADDIESLRDSVARPRDGVIDDDTDAGMVAEAEATLRRMTEALSALDRAREAGR